MTAPARILVSPAPKRADPSRTPAVRPRPIPSPHHRGRARRGTPPFWVMTALIVTGMIVGIVSLSALAVQASFRSDDLRQQLGSLTQRQQSLREDVAAASAPSRVMRWARSEGMVMPERVVILRVPSDPSGLGA
jgi:hypothetical protein